MDLAMLSPSRGSHVPGSSGEGEMLEVRIEECERNLPVSTPNATGLASRLSGRWVYDVEESRP